MLSPAFSKLTGGSRPKAQLTRVRGVRSFLADIACLRRLTPPARCDRQPHQGCGAGVGEAGPTSPANRPWTNRSAHRPNTGTEGSVPGCVINFLCMGAGADRLFVIMVGV